MNGEMRGLLVFLLALLGAVVVRGQHWTCLAEDFRYDMTMYVVVELNGNRVVDYSGLEVGAFVGEECRGVMEVQELVVGGERVCFGYLRLRSNVTAGERFSFRLYMEGGEREVELTADREIEFESEGLLGLPSSPVVLRGEYDARGDVNGDGRVTIADVTALVNIVIGRSSAENAENADVDGSGEVTVADVRALVEVVLQPHPGAPPQPSPQGEGVSPTPALPKGGGRTARQKYLWEKDIRDIEKNPCHPWLQDWKLRIEN